MPTMPTGTTSGAPRLSDAGPARPSPVGPAAAPPEAPRTRAERQLRLFAVLVAAHSLAIGVGLVAWPGLLTRFAGFGQVEPVFFARQAGVFHLVLAAGYLLDARRGSVDFLVAAKLVAVCFLGWATLAGAAPWSVSFSGAADGAMGLGALWLRRRARPAAQPFPTR